MTRRSAIATIAAAAASPACRKRDPVRLQETEETAPVLESTVHMADPKAAIQLLKGFHQIEQNSWRWTMSRFSVTLRPPAGAHEKGARLVVKFTLPDAVLAKIKSTTLTASVAGQQLGSSTYSASGEHSFTVDAPSSMLTTDTVTVDFALNNFLPAGSVDGRELGLVVSSIGLEPK